MFSVNNNPILADDIVVLEELKNQLELNGIYKFATFKVGPNNIQFNCPIHNDGQERRPSCGISTTSKEGAPAGTVHCFTCGYTANLEQMISHCFGYDDEGTFGREWLVKNFLTIAVEDRKEIQLDFGRHKSINKVSYVSEEELDSYRYYHPYMYKRGLTNEVIEKFDIGYDKHFNLNGRILRCITFPVRDTDGNTLFIARRCVDTKLFHYPEGVNKPVYGLYELPENCPEIIVCESMFNALTCYVYGKPAVALLGLGTEQQYEQLRQLPCRKIIAGFDPDPAGMRATQRLKKALGRTKLVTSYIIPEGKDINDLTEEEFNNLEEVF